MSFTPPSRRTQLEAIGARRASLPPAGGTKSSKGAEGGASAEEQEEAYLESTAAAWRIGALDLYAPRGRG